MREGSSRRGRKRRTWNEVLPEEEENNHKSDSDQRRSSTWRHPSASCSAHSGFTPTSFWLHSDLLPSLQHLWSLNPSSFLSPCKSSGPALFFFFRMAGSTGSDLTRHPCGCMCVRRSRSRTNPTLMMSDAENDTDHVSLISRLEGSLEKCASFLGLL